MTRCAMATYARRGNSCPIAPPTGSAAGRATQIPSRVETARRGINAPRAPTAPRCWCATFGMTPRSESTAAGRQRRARRSTSDSRRRSSAALLMPRSCMVTDTPRFRGQEKVRAQCLMVAAAQNIKKIARLLAQLLWPLLAFNEPRKPSSGPVSLHQPKKIASTTQRPDSHSRLHKQQTLPEKSGFVSSLRPRNRGLCLSQFDSLLIRCACSLAPWLSRSVDRLNRRR